MRNIKLLVATLLASTSLMAQNIFTAIPTTSSGLPNNFNNSHIAIGDVDGDGDIDVFISGTLGSDFVGKLYLNNGAGVFTEKTNANLIGTIVGSSEFADVDGDGDLDLFICGRIDNTPTIITRVYRNDGTGVFSLITNTLTGVEGGQLATGDIDGDGDVDLIITGKAAGNVATTKVYKNNGTGTFTEFAAGLRNAQQSSIALGNIDYVQGVDTDLDYVLAGAFSPNMGVQVYANNGTGVGTAITNYELPNTVEGMIKLFDYDNDGDLDLLVTGGSYVSRIFRNNGSGLFLANTQQLPAFSFTSITVGDFNGDNYKDFIINGNESGTNIAYIFINNNGDGTFTQHTQTLNGGSRGNIVSADFDGDGDLDLIISGGTSYSQYYRNGVCALNLPPSVPTLETPCIITSLTQLTSPTVTDCNGTTIVGTPSGTTPINTGGMVRWTYSFEGETHTLTQNISVVNNGVVPIPNTTNLTAISTRCGAASLTSPTALSACGQTINGTPSLTNFQISQTITWTYRDNFGNTSTQQQEYIVEQEINNAVTINGDGSLTATEDDEHIEYLWLDCNDTGLVLDNNTSRTFIAPSTGNYQVRLRNEACELFSACYTVNYVNTEAINKYNAVIYPNPTNGEVTLSWDQSITAGTIEILDAMGRLVETFQFENQTQKAIQLDGKAGIYNIRFTNEQGTFTQRIVKQ